MSSLFWPSLCSRAADGGLLAQIVVVLAVGQALASSLRSSSSGSSGASLLSGVQMHPKSRAACLQNWRVVLGTLHRGGTILLPCDPSLLSPVPSSKPGEGLVPFSLLFSPEDLVAPTLDPQVLWRLLAAVVLRQSTKERVEHRGGRAHCGGCEEKNNGMRRQRTMHDHAANAGALPWGLAVSKSSKPRCRSARARHRCHAPLPLRSNQPQMQLKATAAARRTIPATLRICIKWQPARLQQLFQWRQRQRQREGPITNCEEAPRLARGSRQPRF